jgi:geranylgeranyl pyrophosphate synthase
MTLTTYSYFAPVQELLAQVEARMLAQADGHHSELEAALKHLIGSGGKRIRPAITLLTGQMLDGELQPLISLSAAIEMLHTATLVHDDLIDGSLLRRGSPTLNAQWTPAATVLTGDFIFARAARLAAETGSVELMSLFAETLSIIVNGEIHQLFANRGFADREDYYRRIYAKTASLFELSARAAAMLCPVDSQTVSQARTYGNQIGMAFQIVDDVLDFTGEQASLGKPIANDLRQGLITLPTLYYLEMYPEDTEMKAVMNGQRSDEERVLRLIDSIRSSGAIEKSLDEAGQFVDRALGALDGLPEGEAFDALESLARYIVDRKR